MKSGEIVIEKVNGDKDIFEAKPVAHGILQALELKIDCNGNVAVWKHHKLVRQYMFKDLLSIAVSDKEDSSLLIEVKV